LHVLQDELERIRRKPAKVVTKVEKVEVIPHDYEEIKHHLHELEE
jgi:hypothetical protein